jgi:hypothetical protein
MKKQILRSPNDKRLEKRVTKSNARTVIAVDMVAIERLYEELFDSIRQPQSDAAKPIVRQ